MPMPTVYAVGTVASGIGAVNPGLPASTVPGDVLVVFIESQDVAAVPAMAGWTEVANAFAATGTVTRLTVRWKRAGPGEAAPTVPDPGDHVVARIVGVRGCVQQGNPVAAFASTTELVSDTSVSIPGATTQFGDCLVLAAFSTGTDVASTAHVSAFANASLVATTERIDNWVADGLGGGIGVASGGYPIRGTYSATTATVVTANFKALISVAFKGAGDFAGPYTGPTPGRLGPTGQWRPQIPGALPEPKTPPVFVGEYETLFSNTTTPKTVDITVQTGDVLVIAGATADSAKTLNTPTGGSHGYTLQKSSATASTTAVYLWTAVAVADETFTLSVTATGAGAQFWGFNVLHYRGSDGVGASAQNGGLGAANVDLPTLGANSAVAVLNGDWNAADGASRTYRTVNGITPVASGSGEQTYFRDAAQYAVYIAQWSDIGAPAQNSYGLTAPAGELYRILAVEVYGTTTVAASDDLSVNAEHAAASAVAQDASTAVTVNAEAPASTGTANSPTPALQVFAECATAGAAANDATASIQSDLVVNAECATATAVGNNAATAVSVLAESAAATGVANSATTAAGVLAEAAATTGTANAATTAVSVLAEAAAAAAAGNDPSAAVTVLAEAAAAVGAAFDAVASQTTDLQVDAGVAAAAAAGLDASTAVSVSAENAASTGTGNNATPALSVLAEHAAASGVGNQSATGVSVSAGNATGSAAGFDPSTVVTVLAGHAATSGQAHDAVADTSSPTSVIAECATASATANNATAAPEVLPSSAAANASALDASPAVQVLAEAAAIVGEAFDVSRIIPSPGTMDSTSGGPTFTSTSRANRVLATASSGAASSSSSPEGRLTATSSGGDS